MTAPTCNRFPISESADVVLLTQRIGRLPEFQAVTPVDRSILATLASELATNIVKYGGRGAITISSRDLVRSLDVLIEARDEGAGISDVQAAMTDGFSTGGSLGLGLPGVRRMADEFRIDSTPGIGTFVAVRKQVAKVAHQTAEVGQAFRPFPGQLRCGDRTVLLRDEKSLWLGIIDGLGHGNAAADAADRAAAVLASRFPSDLQLMDEVHRALEHSAGAVMGLLQVWLADGSFVYRGVGNTGAVRCVGDPWHGVSRDGVVGLRPPSDRLQRGRLALGDLLLLSTDGISEQQARPMLASRRDLPAQTLADLVLNQLAKPHDDAACIVLKWCAR
jgi:anti-sigma regulatory factor (Ser/Thr protein kinase)